MTVTMEAAMKAFDRVAVDIRVFFFCSAFVLTLTIRRWRRTNGQLAGNACAARQRLGFRWRSAATMAMYSNTRFRLVKIARPFNT